MSIAPEPILRAGMDTVAWACVYVRNETVRDGAPTKMINDAMEAIHSVPKMLIDWRFDTLREIRMHLACFPASRWPGAPDLVAFFEHRLSHYGYDENA